MPANTAAGVATVTITSGDNVLSLGMATLAPFAPGLFTASATGQGVAAAVALRIKADGTLLYEPVAQYDSVRNQFVALPIDLGAVNDQVFLLLFGTGVRGRSASSPVTARFGTTSAEVLYAGAQGELIGLDQLNVRVPRSLLGRGEIEIEMTVDGKPTNAVRVAIK